MVDEKDSLVAQWRTEAEASLVEAAKAIEAAQAASKLLDEFAAVEDRAVLLAEELAESKDTVSYLTKENRLLEKQVDEMRPRVEAWEKEEPLLERALAAAQAALQSEQNKLAAALKTIDQERAQWERK